MERTLIRGVILVIDNLDQTERLLCKLEESLPLAAHATPALAASIREQSGGIEVSPSCRVTRVHYLGDEGGILCRLAFDEEIGPRAFIVSITHLLFDRRLPLAREIASYQKHRVKRLRRARGGDAINH
jgi:hypothetical protein